MTDHRTETYKSMIAISLEAIKYCALANGGAAVALLAFIGNVSAKASSPNSPDLSGAMGWFLLGLLFTGMLIGASYLTQLTLYNESFRDPVPRTSAKHKYFLWAGFILFALSLGSFGAGAFSAVNAWAVPEKSVVDSVVPTSPTEAI